MNTYWKLTLSIENRVSNMPDVRTRHRRMSWIPATIRIHVLYTCWYTLHSI